MPQARALVSSQSLIENDPDQIYSQNKPWSASAAERLHKISPSIAPKHPLPMPRSFQFNINHLFDVFSQNKEADSTMKDFDLQSGEGDAATHSEFPKPSRVQIGLDPNGGKNAEDFNSNFISSVPTLSSKPSMSDAGYFANLNTLGEADVYFQSSYIVPTKPRPSHTQRRLEWISNSGETVQEQATDLGSELGDGKLPFSSGPAYQQTPAELFSGYKIPTQQSQVFPKQVEPIYSAQPVSHYPKQSEIFTAQINPASNDYGEAQHEQMAYSNPTNLSSVQLAYERVPSGHYSADQLKPSGKYNGQHQTWHLPQFTFPSGHYGQFEPLYGERHSVETVPLPQPVQSFLYPVFQSEYEDPLFGYNREVAAPNYATGNVMLLWPKDYSSFLPYQYGIDHSGQYSLPPYVTTPYSEPIFQYPPVNYETQIRLPEHHSGRRQLDRKPYYTKLFIDVEDEADGSQTRHYGGYLD
ncbi:uncharacterized protein LOC113132448 isoform X1 [Mastacembelus armatus]|uniref:uncharacterized protein LOC113132448 isoform X1 n=1 Tax=Mastacembelus armatus TaxID=205130 RepID=UPI000E4604B5|nr:uncharacterized protein LOC113132448 isoform X1 [Mastacembelus armatus]